MKGALAFSLLRWPVTGANVSYLRFQGRQQSAEGCRNCLNPLLANAQGPLQLAELQNGRSMSLAARAVPSDEVPSYELTNLWTKCKANEAFECGCI
jgi:hypothetical protein